MDWLTELLDEYPTKRTETAVSRLVKVFEDTPDSIMQQATYAYMRHGQFFPKIADLRPFVDAALEDDRGGVSFSELDQQGQIRYGGYSDDEMLAWEIERGSMREESKIEAEILLARQLLPEIAAHTPILSSNTYRNI